jgi:hypothetical protein
LNNKTPEIMKKLVPYSIMLFFAFVIISCKKTQVAPHSIVGRWSLVSDSAKFQYDSPSVYIGKPADYYDFEANGTVSWYENGMGSDSGFYTLNGSAKVTLSYFPKSSTSYSVDTITPFVITSLTAHSMVLTCGPYPTSGTLGEITEIMTLSR